MFNFWLEKQIKLESRIDARFLRIYLAFFYCPLLLDTIEMRLHSCSASFHMQLTQYKSIEQTHKTNKLHTFRKTIIVRCLRFVSFLFCASVVFVVFLLFFVFCWFYSHTN